MAHFSSRNRVVPRSPSRSAPVMAVGQRVFIDVAGNRSGSVILADESGKVLSTVHLADGFEVEVVAWRPRGGDTRYRIRTPQGVDGWLPASNLRPAVVTPPASEPPVSAGSTSVPDSEGRRFGQHSHPEVSLASRASGSSTPAAPTPSVPGGGRRFGQHFLTESCTAARIGG